MNEELSQPIIADLSESKRSVDEQGVAIVRMLTDCFRDKNWQLADDLISWTDPAAEDLAILVCILTGTRHVPRIHLPSRPKFFLEVFKRYEADKGLKEAKFALLPLQ